jgi:hypothetical protein
MFDINNIPAVGQEMLAAVAAHAGWTPGQPIKLTPLSEQIVSTARRLDERARHRKAAITASRAAKQAAA